jgi:hypothetical protein
MLCQLLFSFWLCQDCTYWVWEWFVLRRVASGFVDFAVGFYPHLSRLPMLRWLQE